MGALRGRSRQGLREELGCSETRYLKDSYQAASGWYPLNHKSSMSTCTIWGRLYHFDPSDQGFGSPGRFRGGVAMKAAVSGKTMLGPLGLPGGVRNWCDGEGLHGGLARGG